MKYTALEILNIAGVENAEKKVGKMSCSIGGIFVNKLDHLIELQDAKKVTVIVAKEEYEAKLKAQREPSQEVKAVLEQKGKEATEKRAELEKAKTESK